MSTPVQTRAIFLVLAVLGLLASLGKRFGLWAPENPTPAYMFVLKSLNTTLWTSTAACLAHCIDCAPVGIESRASGPGFFRRAKPHATRVWRLCVYALLPTFGFHLMASLVGPGTVLSAFFWAQISSYGAVVHTPEQRRAEQIFKRNVVVFYGMLCAAILFTGEALIALRAQLGNAGMLAMPMSLLAVGCPLLELFVFSISTSLVTVMQGFTIPAVCADFAPGCPWPPTHIERKEWTSDSITLQWGSEAATGAPAAPARQMFGEVTYELQWRTQISTQGGDAGPWCMASDTLKQPVVKKKNLKEGQIYAFRVRGKHSMGWGEYSNPVVFVARNTGHEQIPVYATLDVLRLGTPKVLQCVMFTVVNYMTGGALFAMHLHTSPYH